MSFPRYPKYKPSGVEWLGEVPAHWEVQPLYGTVVERAESNEGMIEDNLLSLSYGRIVPKDINSNDGLLPESFETYQIVRPGNIVLRLTDLQNDKRSLRSALVEEKGIITFAYLAVAPKKDSSKYLSYLFRAYDATKVFYSMGGGLRQSMKFADLKRMPVVLPPLAEQTRIAEFLDRETAKIDELVAEQRRLMELLKEKRQAVISHAVTRGLNPQAPLKPSVIDWLGDVPAHWKITRIKKLSSLISKGTTPTTVGADFTLEGIRFLKAENVTEAGVSAQPEFFISEAAHEVLSRSSLKEGDVLVVIAGATTGKSAVLGKEFLPANTNQAVSFIRLIDTSISSYISMWLGSRACGI